jgi:hypothetical protein
MIFTPHIIVGAAIGAKTHNLGLIIILGLLTHFILDKVPHWDYNLPAVFREFRENKKIKPLISDFVKMAIDITIGLLIVFIIIWSRNLLNFNYLFFISIGIIISILPDVVFGFVYLIPGKAARKINKIGEFFHCKNKEKEGKITLLNISTQILIIIVSIIILFS